MPVLLVTDMRHSSFAPGAVRSTAVRILSHLSSPMRTHTSSTYPALVFGPTYTTWLKWLNSLKFSTRLREVACEVSLDQFVYAPSQSSPRARITFPVLTQYAFS